MERRHDVAPLTDDQRELVERHDHLTTFATLRYPHLVRAIGDRDEALSLASLALCEAARRFKPGRGTYPTFALAYIWGAWMTAARGGNDPIRVKSHLPGETVRHRVASLDALSVRDLEGELGFARNSVLAAPEPDEPACDLLERGTLTAALGRLKPRERLVLSLRFEERWTFPRIAKRLRTTRQRAHQVYQRAIAKLGRLLTLDADGLHAKEVVR